MAAMGKYCKAYPVRMFREFSGWKEDLRNLRKEKPEGGPPKEASAGRRPKKMSQADTLPVGTPRALTEEDHFYLQENFTVTDGIFTDENIVFDNVGPEWLDYCRDTLKFEVPVFETVQTLSSVA